MFLNKHYQNAYVVADTDRALEVLRREHGIGHADVFEVTQRMWTPHGEGDAVLRLTFAFAGALQYELIQPLGGMDRIYSEAVSATRPMVFHHVAMRCDDYDALEAEVARQEKKIAVKGEAGPVRFLYVDARDTLGHYLEYVSAPPEFWAAFPTEG
jgi:hypothetical protein